jgi:hypothetical protein
VNFQWTRSGLRLSLFYHPGKRDISSDNGSVRIKYIRALRMLQMVGQYDVLGFVRRASLRTDHECQRLFMPDRRLHYMGWCWGSCFYLLQNQRRVHSVDVAEVACCCVVAEHNPCSIRPWRRVSVTNQAANHGNFFVSLFCAILIVLCTPR